MAGTPFNRFLDPDKADTPAIWKAAAFGMFLVAVSVGAAVVSQVGGVIYLGGLDVTWGNVVWLWGHVTAGAVALLAVILEAARANLALRELTE